MRKRWLVLLAAPLAWLALLVSLALAGAAALCVPSGCSVHGPAPGHTGPRENVAAAVLKPVGIDAVAISHWRNVISSLRTTLGSRPSRAACRISLILAEGSSHGVANKQDSPLPSGVRNSPAPFARAYHTYKPTLGVTPVLLMVLGVYQGEDRWNKP